MNESIATRLRPAVLAGLLVATAVNPASAATIYMNFSGVTTTSNVSLPAIPVGTAISLTYAFDTAAIDTNAAANIGRYALTSFTVNVGGNAFTATPLSTSYVQISNNAGGSYDDFYLVYNLSDALSGPLINGAALTGASADLRDDEAGQFNSDDLVLTPDPLSQFERKRFTLDFNLNPGTASIIGQINSWTVVPAPVPVPAAFWLLGGALGALGCLARRVPQRCGKQI